MDSELLKCYAVMGYKFPDRPAYFSFLEENKGIFLGEKERFGPYVEPLFFKTPAEAENWILNFLSRQTDPESFKLKVVECKIDREVYDNRFKARNFLIRVKKVPHNFFETRPNLKSAYLEGDLVLGRGNTIARSKNQKWFETEEEARNQIENLTENVLFRGFDFQIEKFLEED